MGWNKMGKKKQCLHFVRIVEPDKAKFPSAVMSSIRTLNKILYSPYDDSTRLYYSILKNSLMSSETSVPLGRITL